MLAESRSGGSTSYGCDGAGCCRAVTTDGYGVRPHGAGAARNTRCDGMVRRDSVLCLDRPPARIPHAGPGDGPTGARRFISPRAPVTHGSLGLPRIVARPVGRETRSDRRTPRVSPIRAI